MRLRKFYLLFLFPVVFFSCVKKKVYPDPLVVENAAVYYSRMTIDNRPVIMEAGIDGYYMYSSYSMDSSSVFRFIADLRQETCDNCKNSLKIQISDYQVSPPNGTPSVENSLRSQPYPFLAGDPEAPYAVQFNAIDDNTASYRWDFGDGTFSTDAAPLKTFSRQGKYRVCLTTTSRNNYVNSICNTQKINVSETSCKTSIQVSAASDNTISFVSNTTGGTKPYMYYWNFGDGTTSNQDAPTCNYQYRGAKVISLRVTDAAGDTAFATYNAKTASDNSSFLANYTIGSIKKLPVPPALSQVIVTWIDGNGVAYTSNNAAQPSDSRFEVLSVTENEKNENGQPTKKISAKFRCKLFNGARSVTVNDAEIVMCVAYK